MHITTYDCPGCINGKLIKLDQITYHCTNYPKCTWKLKDDEVPLLSTYWIDGRAFVYEEEGQIEYFLRFENSEFFQEQCIRSYCGGLRPVSKCRPLNYICKSKYLKNDNKIHSKRF